MAWSPEEAVQYYKKQGAPADQSALISLLKEIQSESGGSIPAAALEAAAAALGIKSSMLYALVKRIPSLRLGDKHTLLMCSGPNCSKAAALAQKAEALCLLHKGKVELRFVPCMRMCGKGPNIKWDGVIHHETSEEFLEKLIVDISR